MNVSLKSNNTDRLHTPLRHAITAAYRRDEAACVRDLLAQWQLSSASLAHIHERARELVVAVRKKRARASGVDQLMRQFSLSSQEGIALMCLAEALLRIPDAGTADRLIRDKISKGDWKSHVGQSPSLFVNAATWGLLITGKLVATTSEQGLHNALRRLIATGGEPLVRKGVDLAMRLLGQQFVKGQTIQQALAASGAQEKQGFRYSYDMLGEAALTEADARRYYAAYETAIHAIGKAGNGRGIYQGPGISIKLSALHPRYTRAQRERVLEELLPRLKRLLRLARDYDIGVNIDAEEADRLDLSLDLLEAVAFDADLRGWNGIGFVAQAYQKRCPFLIDYLIHLARRSDRRLMIRLVKGAYWDSEIKRAQVDGLRDYPVYTRKAHSDLSYLVCARKLLAANDAVYPQFATHNAHTLSAVYQVARDQGVTDYEFQCLHGMGEALYDEVIGSKNFDRPCRIYSPVGSHETLLPYLVRRLLENGANSSFVNRIVDDDVSIEELIADPVERVRREGGLPHPRISLPRDLYGPARRNSEGVDLSDETTLATLQIELNQLAGKTWRAVPQLANGQGNGNTERPVINPADRRDNVGAVRSASLDDVDAALAAAVAFAPRWSQTPAAERAAMLERAAERLEQHRAALISLCVREAGKTWPNAVAEVREAVDFCRYYAQQMRVQFPGRSPDALGPVVCISPWNFPLAIFVGEVAAALAAGNPVLAKSAEQTSLIAGFAVELLHQAGVPRAALQFVPGPGRSVGNALIADARVRGVIFTGSTEVAQLINRRLAERAVGGEEIPLIAETGGQNAMIVDSSALPEQVVQDVLASAFDSAGQRCSALRVLCLQRDVADKLLEMLKGAMRELRIGNPAQLRTDIGPVIDADAQQGLLAHIQRMWQLGRRVYQLPLDVECAHGTFIPPTLIEIDSIAELEREVFGPILHVLRFDSDQIEQLVADINATGYGLTFGMHSRVDERIGFVTARIHAGNLYVNRNMVGAVVGVQPFGGEGKSGTGPKAGGPLYLHRLLAEQSVPPEAIAATGHVSDAAFSKSVQLSAPEALRAWAQDSGRRELAAWCRRYAEITLLGRRCELPGPTGETNTLIFVPRGTVACLADSEPQLLIQIAAALAAGNDTVIEPSPTNAALLSALPPAVARHVRIADWKHESVVAVLFAGAPEAATQLRRELAARDGALVPLLVAHDGHTYPLFRLVAERTLTINTAAAGGNASLMTLSP